MFVLIFPRYIGCFYLATWFFFFTTAVSVHAQERTEEAIVSHMVREAARESADRIGAGSLFLRIFPCDAHPLISQIFSEEFSAKGIAVSLENPIAEKKVTVDIRDMHASAVLIDKSSYLRTITLLFGVMAEERSTGAIVWSREFEFSRNDTLNGMPAYKQKDLMRADNPTWFDALITPAIVSAIAVIIIVLLFTVRGS